MDRNSNSVKSSNKASDSLDKVEENQQQMLFGKETSRKPFGELYDSSIVSKVKNVTKFR